MPPRKREKPEPPPRKPRGRIDGSITFRELRLAVQAVADRCERLMQMVERAESSYNYER